MQLRTLPLSIERFLLSPFSLLLALVLAFFLNSWSMPLTDVDEGALLGKCQPGQAFFALAQKAGSALDYQA